MKRTVLFLVMLASCGCGSPLGIDGPLSLPLKAEIRRHCCVGLGCCPAGTRTCSCPADEELGTICPPIGCNSPFPGPMQQVTVERIE